MEGCTVTQVGWEVTIGVTIHDEMFDLRPNGADVGHLRRELWERFGKICCQESINGPKLGGVIEFKFKRCHKTHKASQQTTLGHLRIERLSRA